MKTSILKQAEAGGLLFDGAMGTVLYQRGVFLNRCSSRLTSSNLNLSKPFIEITSQPVHSFRQPTHWCQPYRLAQHNLENKVVEINRSAVAIARKAIGDRGYVAGSVGPTGCGLTELAGEQGQNVREAFVEQISVLVDAGVDCIILETFDVLQELELATEIARSTTELPIVSLMMFGANARSIGGGLTPQQVAPRLIDAGADIIGANCGGGPELLFKITTSMVGHGKPVMAQPNAGQPETIEGRSIYVANPNIFGVYARRLLKAGVRVIGGCCGTTPEHIERMANAARMMMANDAAGAPSTVRIESVGTEPIAPRLPGPTLLLN